MKILIYLILLSCIFHFGCKKKRSNENISMDFYLSGGKSDSTFVKFSISENQNTKIEKEIVYKSVDSRYKNWLVTFKPKNETSQQWEITDNLGRRIPICVTTTCG
jgi:hypothetical protein